MGNRDPSLNKKTMQIRVGGPDLHGKKKMHLTGVEPAHMPPEGTALSIELQMHLVHYILEVRKKQVFM